MIFGAPTLPEIRTAHFGYKGVTWCIVPTTACGWATSYTPTGTCFNPPTHVLSSTPLHGLSPGDQYMSATTSGNTTSSS